MRSLFLHGYGLSIKVKNTRMVFSQGIDPFSSKRESSTGNAYIYSPYIDAETNDNTSCIVGGMPFELPTYNDAVAFAKSNLSFGSRLAR